MLFSVLHSPVGGTAMTPLQAGRPGGELPRLAQGGRMGAVRERSWASRACPYGFRSLFPLLRRGRQSPRAGSTVRRTFHGPCNCQKSRRRSFLVDEMGTRDLPSRIPEASMSETPRARSLVPVFLEISHLYQEVLVFVTTL